MRLLLAVILVIVVGCLSEMQTRNRSMKEQKSYPPYKICYGVNHKLSREWKEAITKGARLLESQLRKHSTQKEWFILDFEDKNCVYGRRTIRVVDQEYFPFKIELCDRAQAFYAPTRNLIVICSVKYDIDYYYGRYIGRKYQQDILRELGREHVVMHELGHVVFGLNHFSGTNCLMSAHSRTKNLCEAEIRLLKESQ